MHVFTVTGFSLQSGNEISTLEIGKHVNSLLYVKVYSTLVFLSVCVVAKLFVSDILGGAPCSGQRAFIYSAVFSIYWRMSVETRRTYK